MKAAPSPARVLALLPGIRGIASLLRKKTLHGNWIRGQISGLQEYCAEWLAPAIWLREWTGTRRTGTTNLRRTWLPQHALMMGRRLPHHTLMMGLRDGYVFHTAVLFFHTDMYFTHLYMPLYCYIIHNTCCYAFWLSIYMPACVMICSSYDAM